MINKKATFSTGTVWEDMASYSRAVRVGDRILVAGTTASGPDNTVVGTDAASQARFIFDKIEFSIKALGGRFEDIVRTRVFVSDIANWEAVARVHGERFRRIKPVNTLVEARLVGPEYLVEIEVEAVIGAGGI